VKVGKMRCINLPLPCVTLAWIVGTISGVLFHFSPSVFIA
jgi:hypothetical protein